MLVYWMIWYCYCFLPGFKCIFQLYSSIFSISWYGYRYHVTFYIGQQHPITVCRTVFGYALFWRWVSLGAPVTISLIEFYFIMTFIMTVVAIIVIFTTIHYFLNYTLGFLQLSSSGSVNAQLPGCFRPWIFSLNIGLNMLPSDSFLSCLYSLLRFLQGNSRLCNWLSLQRLVPWISHLLPVCWSTFWKYNLKW